MLFFFYFQKSPLENLSGHLKCAGVILTLTLRRPFFKNFVSVQLLKFEYILFILPK